MPGGELIVKPDLTPAVALSASPVDQFYDWERRGRGWQIWDCRAYLEPPFRPFLRYSLPTPRVDPNEGRRHTVGSWLLEKAKDALSGRKPTAFEAETLDPDLLAFLEEPELPPYWDEDEIIDIQVTLPNDAKVSNETFSFFLLGLSHCSCPLSFEVIGAPASIVVQIGCRERDVEQVREQLAAHFPMAKFKSARGFLSGLWTADPDTPGMIVDFGLSHEFMLPLKTLGTAPDPLVTITGALANLRDGEVGLLQVLFEPVRHPWADSILRAVMKDEGGPFFDDAPEMVGLARQKIRSPLYAAVIRIAAKSEDEGRIWQILKSAAAGLNHLSNPGVNELLPLNNDGYDPLDHEQDLLHRVSHRGGMLLNTDELVSLVHLPTAAVRSPKLKRQAEKTKAAPALAFGHELVLGENEHEGELQTVTLSADQRVRHTYVIGASGTGKSTFLLNCVIQDIERGDGLAVLDPHGDLIDQILERIPENRWGDVILFDPSDEAYPIGFNILSAHSETEKQLLSSDLVAIFRRLSTAWGDQMNSVLGNAILAFLESERGGTLADMRRFLVEKEFREEFLKSVTDSEIVYYWRKEFPLLTGKPQGPLLTRLDTFLRPKLVRHMVAQKENKLDFAEIMNGRKIFLAKLAHGGIGEENALLLGSLIVSKFHQLTLARQEMKASDRRPFYLYIDEFHNFVTPSMASILSGARKYRLGLVLAHQEYRQIKNEEVAGAVIANPYTRVCFRLGDQDARKLEDGFSFFEAKDLQNLGTGEAICRFERADYDFNLQTASLAPVEAELARERIERITQLSRQRYGTPREKVLDELNRASAPSSEAQPAEKAAPRAAKSKQPSTDQVPKPPASPDLNTAATSDSDILSAPDMEPDARSFPQDSSASPGGEASSPAEVEAQIATLREPPAVESDAEPLPDLEPNAPSITPAYTPNGEPPPVPTKPEPPAPKPPSSGRGGQAHKNLQQLIKLRAEGLGWRADIEKPILAGSGSIDIALEKDGLCIACEICVTSPVEQEMGNIEKCLKAGLTTIVSVCEDAKRLAKIRVAAEQKFSINELERVKFFTLEQLFENLEEVTARSIVKQKKSRGYNVTATYSAPGKTEKKARKKSLGDALVDSIDELRQQEELKKKPGKPGRKPKGKDGSAPET